MKTSHLRPLRATVLILSSISMLSFAQTLPGQGNPVIVGGAAVYKGDPLDANVKIDKVLEIQGQPPAGWVPKFEFQVGVKEILPRAPQGCQWKPVTYNPPSGNTSVSSGQNATVQVKNVLVCEDEFCAQAKPLSINLGQAASWLIPGTSTPRAIVSPVVGWATPTSVPEKALGEWVGFNSSGSVSSFDSEIPFCLCGNSKADARVDHLRGDNHAEVFFNSAATMVANTAVQDPASFAPSRTGVSGTNGVSTSGNHKLIAKITNQTGATGFTMNGYLNINKGYLGACKLIK